MGKHAFSIQPTIIIAFTHINRSFFDGNKEAFSRKQPLAENSTLDPKGLSISQDGRTQA